jgi:hypothetical protein
VRHADHARLQDLCVDYYALSPIRASGIGVMTAFISDLGMPRDSGLEIQRADPLAAALDHVLGPVYQSQISLGVDNPDIACPEEKKGQ